MCEANFIVVKYCYRAKGNNNKRQRLAKYDFQQILKRDPIKTVKKNSVKVRRGNDLRKYFKQGFNVQNIKRNKGL